MGVEVVLIIAITSGVIALISGGTSIGTFFHFKKKFKKMNKEKMKLDIENEDIDIENKAGHKHIKKQSIHFEQAGVEMVNMSNNMLETGRPNKVAESLADAAGVGMGALSGPEDIQSIFGSGVQSLTSSGRNTPALEYNDDALLDNHHAPVPVRFSTRLEVPEMKQASHSRHQSRDFADEVRGNLFNLLSQEVSGQTTPRSIELAQDVIADYPNPLIARQEMGSDASVIISGDSEAIDV